MRHTWHPMNRLRLQVRGFEGGPRSEVVPFIDDVPLAEIVARFEEENGYPVTQRGGIVPANIRIGYTLPDFYFGTPKPRLFTEHGKIPVLHCSCGELGCAPLWACVEVSADHVTWHSLHKSSQNVSDYSDLGPFTFAREGYEHEVAELADQLAIWPGASGIEET